ncbi:MAG: AAA family ATPase [Candidatus Cyclobacteriaceae bacterium M3_2C_046]
MIIAFHGLPGTGKSFYARHLADYLGWLRLDSDQIRHSMNLKGQYNEQAKYQVYQRLVSIALQSEPCIIDASFLKKTYRDLLLNQACHDRVIIIEVKASDQTVKKRIDKDRKYSEAGYEVFLQLKKDVDPLVYPHLVIYNEKHSDIRENMNIIMAYLDQPYGS